MKCCICGEKVTRTQLQHAEAIKTKNGYEHTDCIDDLGRDPGDAYYRDPDHLTKDRPTT